MLWNYSNLGIELYSWELLPDLFEGFDKQYTENKRETIHTISCLSWKLKGSQKLEAVRFKTWTEILW